MLTGIFTIKGRADVVQLDDEGQGKTIRISEDGKKLFVDIVSYDQSNEPSHGDPIRPATARLPDDTTMEDARRPSKKIGTLGHR